MNNGTTTWVQGETKQKSNKFCKKCPVTYQRLEPQTTHIEIPYTLNCGSDEICDADLIVNARFTELR